MLAAVSAVCSLVSCQEAPLSPDSVIVTSETNKNAFDLWLENNFLKNYNIDFKYRFEQNEADMNFYTVPATYDNSIIMANLVMHLCVETYDEVAGPDFTKGYFPKMFFLIGEWEYLNNGTFILGTAEGGKKIMLSGVNEIKEHLGSAEELNHFYIKTIHHEFTHILNQTTTYQTDFKLVTPNGYVADNWSSKPYNAEYLKNGFITAYAQHSHEEDFAEMMSEYITHDQAWWDAQISTPGCNAAAIKSKLDLVRSYMDEVWNIDLEQLREVVLRREAEVVAGSVDLNDITIDHFNSCPLK